TFRRQTALKMMRRAATAHTAVGTLRTITSGGERLGEELHEWGHRTFGLTINEFYGQTEANLLVGNCAALMPTRPGSMGRAIPGHTVAVIGEDGRVKPRGETGMIAARRPDPVFFLEYWRQPEAEPEKFVGHLP